MALRLIREDERVERTIGGTTFTVRLCPHGVHRRLRAKHTRAGRLDQDALNGEVLATSIVGWRDLADGEGADIPFRPDLVEPVLMALPEGVVLELLLTALGPAQAAQEALGN